MQNTSIIRAVEINSVLRNTYLLLSMTLFVTAITAYIGTLYTFSLGVYIAAVIGIFLLIFAIGATRNSGWSVFLVFIFTGLMGLILGPSLQHVLKNANGSLIIAQAAATTALMFIALSGYVLVTRKNFNFLGGMLFMSLIGLVIVGFIASFFHTPMLHNVISFVSVIVFSGYILYDTSEIIHGGQTNYVLATVNLYLDIFNIFSNLLQLFGNDE